LQYSLKFTFLKTVDFISLIRFSTNIMFLWHLNSLAYMSVYYTFDCSIYLFFTAEYFVFAPEMNKWSVQLEYMLSDVVSHTHMR